MKVGDRVIWDEPYEQWNLNKFTIAEVIWSWIPSSDRIKIRVRYVNGATKLETWVNKSDIRIDTQYYREIKLNKLLGR